MWAGDEGIVAHELLEDVNLGATDLEYSSRFEHSCGAVDTDGLKRKSSNLRERQANA